MNSKKAQISDAVFMIYRIVLITVIAVVILGLSSVFFEYYLDIKNAEAQILGEKIYSCVVDEGVLDIDEIKNSDLFKEGGILGYCGYDGLEGIYFEMFYFFDGVSEKFEGGDSGLVWIKDVDWEVDMKKYELGIYRNEEDVVFVNEEGVFNDGGLKLNIYVSRDR